MVIVPAFRSLLVQCQKRSWSLRFGNLQLSSVCSGSSPGRPQSSTTLHSVGCNRPEQQGRTKQLSGSQLQACSGSHSGGQKMLRIVAQGHPHSGFESEILRVRAVSDSALPLAVRGRHTLKVRPNFSLTQLYQEIYLCLMTLTNIIICYCYDLHSQAYTLLTQKREQRYKMEGRDLRPQVCGTEV